MTSGEAHRFGDSSSLPPLLSRLRGSLSFSRQNQEGRQGPPHFTDDEMDEKVGNHWSFGVSLRKCQEYKPISDINSKDIHRILNSSPRPRNLQSPEKL